MNMRTWQWATKSVAVWARQFHPQRMHEVIRKTCRQAGMAGIEGHREFFSEDGEQGLERIGRDYRDEGLAIHSFHLPYRGPADDISSFSEYNRRQGVDTARQWMGRAAALGVKVVIEHPAINRAPVEVDGIDNFMRALDRSLSVLLPEAASLGLILALENMTPGPEGGRFGSEPEHFERLAAAFDHPSLGFCLDTGHALLSCHGRAPRMLGAMEPKLAAFHLADNAGDRDSHLAPGRGRVEWAPVFQCMARIGYSGIACIETPPFAYGPDYAPEAFTELIQQTDALVDRTLAPAATQ